MKSRIAVVLTLVVAIAIPVLAEDAVKSPMKAGKWQYTMQMEVPGMPFKIPPVNFTHCLTQEDIDKDPQATLPSDKKSDCKMADYKVTGKTVTWSVNCPKQKTTGKGEITYTDDSFDGVMKMDMDGTASTTKYSGKRLGDCEKKK